VLIFKCKRKFRHKNDTKVDALTESKDADVKKSPEVVVKDNWVNESDDTESITWRDVSETLDLVFGISAIVWLCLSALVFFSMVSPEN
jgi:hypothetical protein